MATQSLNDLGTGVESLSTTTTEITGDVTVIQSKIGSTAGTLVEFKNYVENVQSVSSSSGILEIDLSLPASIFYITLTENISSVELINAPAGACSITLEVTQHASSPKTLAWGSGWKYHNSAAPTVTATISKIDFFLIYTRDQGVTKIVAPGWYNVG